MEINGIINEVPYSEKKRVACENYIAILLEVPPKVIFNENVFVYNLRGDFLWQISDFYIQKYQRSEDCPFVDVVFNEMQELILFNWEGWKLTVKPDTGEELSYEFTK